jgi:hypothetical protein
MILCVPPLPAMHITCERAYGDEDCAAVGDLGVDGTELEGVADLDIVWVCVFSENNKDNTSLSCAINLLFKRDDEVCQFEDCQRRTST